MTPARRDAERASGVKELAPCAGSRGELRRRGRNFMGNISPREAPANIATPSADPIFLAIDTHKTAYAACRRAICDQTPVSKDIDEAEIEKAAVVDWHAFEALFRTVPTTLAGFAALFEYLGSDRWALDEETEHPRSMLGWAAGLFHEPGDEHEFPSAKEWTEMMATGLRRLAEAAAG
jgi:hypothetical protein